MRKTIRFCALHGNNLAALVAAAATLLMPVAVHGQACAGNPSVGCLRPGAACTVRGQSGQCKTPAGFPLGERECKCEAAPSPPVTIKPKYLVLAVLYSPPGCTSTANNPCADGSSVVDYASGSSLGSKVTVKDSFRGEDKVSLDLAGSWGVDADFTITEADGVSAAITKSSTHEIKALGNGDGINHGQDQFILLLDPTVTLRQEHVNLYWTPGYEGSLLELYEVYASELRRPSTMRPAVSAELQRLGFTKEDYQNILSLDPYGGTVCDVPAHVACPAGLTTDGHGVVLNSTRFTPTTWVLPYEPLAQSTNCNNGVCHCTVISGEPIKNDIVDENSSESTSEYTVSFHGDTPLSDIVGLKESGQLTFTDSSTSTSTRDSSQSATATVTCPSPGYTGPQHIAIYWDKLWGTFLFVPYDTSSAHVVQHGKVMNASGKPAPGQPVNLSYGGKTYHTVTGRNGTYEFFVMAGHVPTARTARLTVGPMQKMVKLGSTRATKIRLQ